jgi:hypothetical protein
LSAEYVRGLFKVDGKIAVIRVRDDDSPVMRWIFEEGLPRGIAIRPANGKHIKQWLVGHPEYEFSKNEFGSN